MHALTDRHQWTREGEACRGKDDAYLAAAFAQLMGNLAHNHGPVSTENRVDYLDLFMKSAKSTPSWSNSGHVSDNTWSD